MNAITYRGSRSRNGCRVVRISGPLAVDLPLRLDLWSHSPTGFEWGYGGSGPAQLALAILADALKDDDQAIELHQVFKWEVVARLPHVSWDLDQQAVLNWLYKHDQLRLDHERAHGSTADPSREEPASFAGDDAEE
jgi:uncharacterized protein DUF6166